MKNNANCNGNLQYAVNELIDFINNTMNDAFGPTDNQGSKWLNMAPC